jgi:predicted RNA-binding Zn ribbon-like protein
MRTAGGGARFEWIGGARALDFVNTVTWTAAGPEHERLAGYRDLLDWACEAGILHPAHATALRRRTGAAQARAVLARARERRRLLHAAFVAAAGNEALPAGEGRALGTALRNTARHLRLEQNAGPWTLAVRPTAPDPDGILHTLTWEAARLLASDDRTRLRHCAAHDCGWVFLDRSRNQGRRWCDMKVCGNTEKARRFYRRRKATGG